jgi:uncharacterized protein
VLELVALQDAELQNTLLTCAREKISKACGSAREPALPIANSIDFEPIDASGVFVSLHIGKRLRGCIGKLRLNEVGLTELSAAAVDAACADPRFQAVRPSELSELLIEVSLLGPLYRCEPEEVVVGKHGLYIRSDDNSGLLLPQVAVERDWSSTEFLQQLRKKAGLKPIATISEQLWCFRAVVFDEEGNLRSY